MSIARLSDPDTPEVVDCAVYVDGERITGDFDFATGLAEVRRRGKGFVWVGLCGPSSDVLTRIGDAAGLHALTLEDMLSPHQRPKLERYDGYWFAVMRTLGYIPHVDVTTASDIVETGEISIALGTDFVVTVRFGRHSKLTEVRRGLEAAPKTLAIGPLAVLHAVADHVVDTYLDVSQRVGEDVDTLEEAVFEPSSKVTVEHIYMLKREVVEMRRAVNPLQDPLIRLTRDQNDPLLGPDGAKTIRHYFRDVLDHQVTVGERISEFDDILSSLVDAVAAQIQVQQNTDMRKISAWAAIAAAPTLIAGVYGMNFRHMPELDWHYGYYGVLGVIAAVAIGLFVTFRHNKWL
ncbi:magnesium and cobalt transport protein CorA [Rhodococcus sp. HNM0569]|uniref:magnesium and cobalt transport protein CorA n=1 Tax=Rhodococcus sp. HNM0569 TaxID=2716340 RepID=UPI003211EE9A